MTLLLLNLRQGLVWRLIAVAAVPFMVWLTMGEGYEFRHERAGGVHYLARIDHRHDRACLIMREADLTAALREYSCMRHNPD